MFLELRFAGRTRFGVVPWSGVVDREGIFSAVASWSVGCGGRRIGVGARRRQLMQAGGRGIRRVESDSAGYRFRDQDVQVRRVSCMCGGKPSVLVARATHEGSVCPVCARERSEAGQGGL
eukprot:2141436-Pleurochrysis_carterae.AAC.3